MEEKAAARSYLERHGTYINALKAVLSDLDAARRTGKAGEEEKLCRIMTMLREMKET